MVVSSSMSQAISPESQSIVLTTAEFLAIQLTPLLCLATPIAMVVLIILGLSDRVVVFFDTKDVLWSLMPFFGMTGSFLIAMGLSLAILGSGSQLGSTALIDLVLIAGFIASLVGSGVTLYNSVVHNRSILVGLVVGFLKIGIASLMGVLSIGQLPRVLRLRKSNRAVPLSLGSLGAHVLSWLWMKLINGPRVHLRRGWLEEREQLWAGLSESPRDRAALLR